MNISDNKERFLAAYKLLSEESTTSDKFESVRKLLHGLNPKVDKALNFCSENLSKIEKLQKGEVIELAAENLPEQTEEEKRRKRALILFIRSWNQLQSEVERIKSEFKAGDTKSLQEQVSTWSKIITLVKGPFGIITIAAIIIVGAFAFINSNKSVDQPIKIKTTSLGKVKIKVIEFNGKKIPLSEIDVREGTDCDSKHYHAHNHTSTKALDGTLVADPGDCGFGRIEEVKVLEIEVPQIN